MPERIEFVIPGVPVAQGRPKFTTVAGRGRAYDPEKSRNWKAYVRLLAARVAPREPWIGPVSLEIAIWMPVPKSWSAKRRAQAVDCYHARTPDADNILKGIKDALTGLIWVDDGQVADPHPVKRYGETPGCAVVITRLPGLPWEKEKEVESRHEMAR